MKQQIIQVRPYTLKELSVLYGVEYRTIKKWIAPFENIVGKKRGRYYTIMQVKMIFDKLGLPSVINDD